MLLKIWLLSIQIVVLKTGLTMKPIIEGGDVVEALRERVLGRVIAGHR